MLNESYIKFLDVSPLKIHLKNLEEVTGHKNKWLVLKELEL